MKLKYLIFLLISFSQAGLIANSQNQKIDSLKRALQEHPEENRFNVLWGLAYELYDVDNPQALGYAKRANEVALSGGDTLQIVKSGTIMGQLLRRADKLDQAIDAFSRVLPISKRHKFEKEIILILNGLAIAHTLKCEYDKALDYHFKSLIILEREGDKKQISVSLNNIGVVHFKLEAFSLALEYYLKALTIKEEINDFYDLESLLVNIGLCYNGLDDCENARNYFNKAVAMCDSSCSRRVTIEIEHGLGETSVLEMKYSEAEFHFKRSLKNSEIQNDQRYQLTSLIALSRLSLEKNLVANARFYIDQAESLPDKNQYKELCLEIYQLKAELFTRFNDFRNANLFRKKYSELKDEVFDSEVKLRMMKVQTQFAERDNLARIESQSNILALQEEAIKNHKLLNLSFGTMVLLTMVLAVVLYRSNTQKQRINVTLNQRVRERTFELERNRDELKHSHDEKDMILKKVSSDLTSSWATLNGLSLLAAKDLPEEQAVYFKAAEATAERMVNSVNKYTSP